MLKCTSHISTLVLAIGLLLSGCDSPNITDLPTGSPILGMESSKNVYAPGEAITFTITNFSPGTIYLQNCGPTKTFYLDEKVNGQWKLKTTSVCLNLYGLTFSPFLKAGEKDTLSMYPLEPGEFRYRILYRYNSSSAKTHELLSRFTVEE